MITYSFITDDPKLAVKIFEIIGHSVGVSATASGALVTTTAAPAPAPAPPAPAPVALPPAAAAAAPPPPAPAPAPAKVKGEAPPGWTIEHITTAAKWHADTHGVASLKAIVAEFGEKKATEVDPAQWPAFHAKLSAGPVAAAS